MLTGLTIGTVGAAAAETATEAVVSAALTPEVFTGFEAVSGPIRPYMSGEALERILKTSPSDQAALQLMEAGNPPGGSAVLERLRDLMPAVEPAEVGQSPVRPVFGSYTGQLSRFSEGAARLMRDAAILSSEEAALLGNLEQAEVMKEASEMLDHISRFADVAGDYMGIASYPEYLARHSPTCE